jgi:hypothetical protein
VDDPAAATAFADAIHEADYSRAHTVMFKYLLPRQKQSERLAFLKAVAGANRVQWARRDAIAAMVADGAVAETGPLMAAATRRTPGEIAGALALACSGHEDPAVRAAAVDIIRRHLQQDDRYCQGQMVSALQRFGADAAPALPAIKAIDPGGDRWLKQVRGRAIADIEKGMAEEGKN